MEQLIVAIYTVFLVFVLYTQFCKLKQIIMFCTISKFQVSEVYPYLASVTLTENL